MAMSEDGDASSTLGKRKAGQTSEEECLGAKQVKPIRQQAFHPPLSSPPSAKAGKEVRQEHPPIETVAKKPAQFYASLPPTQLQLPTQLTTFSYDEQRTLHHDDRSRKFFLYPSIGLDLNRGFEQLISRDESVNEHLDSLLLALMEHSKRSESHDLERKRANVITWRGMATKLCTALYEDRNGFEMNAMMVGHTLYLEEHIGPSQAAEKSRQQSDQRLQRFGYYGYAFESYSCFSDSKPRVLWDGNVNTNVQWCSVVKTKLGPSRMILGGEVDAVEQPRPDSKNQAPVPVEVKTSMQLRSPIDQQRFEAKLLRFYFQSFLLGVPKVVVGFRDRKGWIREVYAYDTLNMPRIVRGKPHEWNPTACLNFASDVITSVRQSISKTAQDSSSGKHSMIDPFNPPPSSSLASASSYPVYRIKFERPFDEISVQRLSEEEVETQVLGSEREKDEERHSKRRVGFLLQDYYDFARESMMRM